MLEREEAVSVYSNVDMTYGRRNFVAYHRGGAAPSIVAPNRSLASYRNKITAILGVTVLYTAFLYKSGTEYKNDGLAAQNISPVDFSYGSWCFLRLSNFIFWLT
jgi:hypothetical protein